MATEVAFKHIDSSFLAALALRDNNAHITVWDMNSTMDPSNPGDTSDLQPIYATTSEHENFSNLSIGLSISSKGDQVAIYQEPRIGQWKDGSKLNKCSFRIRLFKNPLVYKSERSDLTRRNINHLFFDSFVGFGTFLTQLNDDKTAWSSIPGVEASDREVISSNNIQSVNRKIPSKRSNTLFAACNGLYIDVFTTLENEWTHIRSIRLTDLVPTFNRRIMCKMMMDVMSSNTFMWLEDNGLCCTLWDLQKGSNISYMSSAKNTRFTGPKFCGHSKIAISPDELIVALARDDTLTTYYASSGIEISTRKYSGHRIEYIAFHGQSNQLFVVVRRAMTLKLGSRMLDPFQLKSQAKVTRVPIPIIGRTILTVFRKGPFKHRGLVCEADGSKIRCYVSYAPVDVNIAKDEDTLVKPSYVSHLQKEKDQKVTALESTKDGSKEHRGESKRYDLRLKGHKESFPDGDGSMYWVLSVDVIERSRGCEKVVFSFVPEPWMRVSTADIGNHDDLVNVYFLPQGTRFVVAGMQTLQIWNFPTEKFNYFHLEFIWSHPKMVEANLYGKVYKSDRVGKYYHCISQPKIYMDKNTDNIVVSFEGKDDFIIPTASGNNTRFKFICCARSIHFLAAAYEYSIQETKKTSKDSPQGTATFEKHADAIAQFTRSHINRLLTSEDFSPHLTGTDSPTWTIDSRPTTPTTPGDRSANDDDTTQLTSNLSQSEQVVNLFTLLLDQDDLKDTNRTFVEGMLDTNTGIWVPHSDMDLNPIAHAIEIKDEKLLKTLIDYCINCAKKYHPAYMAPVEQCLAELLRHYPDIVVYIFRSTSYIPAHNHAYVASHAIGFNSRFQDFMDGTENTVFILRSQLPTDRRLHQGLEPRYPAKVSHQPIYKKRTYKIYVSPFQFRHVNTSKDTQDDHDPHKQHRKESVFNLITGKVFFDNPVIVASLRYKWYKFAIKYWLVRFCLVLTFFILMITITAKQISVSSVKKGHIPTADEIAARYLPEWRSVFVVTMTIGLVLLGYEVRQMTYSPKKYL
ncbi:hypothetical protein BGZ65_003067, partial [Modicella reniformis]